MSLEKIFEGKSVDEAIAALKGGEKQVDVLELMKDWNPNKHDIHDINLYPEEKKLKEKASQRFDDKSGKVIDIPAEYENGPPRNRISVPIEQDIVNLHTAFTVGIEPTLDCTPEGEEENLFEAIKAVYKRGKLKYKNKKIVRSWLAETEVAEYWYAEENASFWGRIKDLVGIKPKLSLKSAIWSPFRGDTLYPTFNDHGDMIAFSRGYKKRDENDNEYECFMTLDDTYIVEFENKDGWKEVKNTKHGFDKIPVIYAKRKEALCSSIKPMRVRLEKLLSSYADCIDYHFFPLLMLFGDVEGFLGKGANRAVNLEGEGADAKYLVWQQAPDTVKLEIENLIDLMYSMTQTPRITFDNLKGIGATSGVAFKFMFMAAHMAVENHAEEIGEFFQRRLNFITSALGTINTRFKSASESIDINTEIVPYMIDNLDDKVTTAVKAVEGGIWSRREGILFAGNIDRIDEELKEIEEQTEDAETPSE